MIYGEIKQKQNKVKKRIWFIINPIAGVRRKDDIPALVRENLNHDLFDFETNFGGATGLSNFRNLGVTRNSEAELLTLINILTDEFRNNQILTNTQVTMLLSAMLSNSENFVNKEMPVPSSGTVTWYLVPLEFTDLKGEANWRTRVDQQMQLLSEYYEFVSYGKLNIKWKIHNSWIMMPGDQAKFEIKLSGDYITTENFWKEAISAADSKIDFTGVQVVNFILPKNHTMLKESAQGFPWTGDINKYNTSKGKIAAFTILGQYFEASHRNYWSYWAHEYGHTLGIPHISGSRTTSTYQTYDLMGNQDSRRELSGWSRFAVTKWLEDKWVYCKSKANITSELVNLADLNSRGDGNKLVVIPLSATKALLVESRNTTKFVGIDSVRGNTDGVLVYVYDATKGHNSEYLFPASSTSDPILSKGESVTYEGVNIKVISVGAQDQILISLKP